MSERLDDRDPAAVDPAAVASTAVAPASTELGATGRGFGASIPRNALRDVASSEVVERVWSRLDANIEPRRRDARWHSPVLWALVASTATFGVGVSVGQRWGSETAPQAVAVGAEPQQAAPASLVERGAEFPNPRSEVRDVDPVLPSNLRRPRQTPAPVTTLSEALDPESVVALDPNSEPPAQIVEVPLAVPPTVPPTWQRLANAGEYEGALFELSQDVGFESVLLDASAEQLMLLADVARATGQTQRALAALRRITSEFRSDPVAPLAAFSLGNLLEKSGDPRGAAEAFAVYRALSPEGDFAEDALVRQIRSAVERNDRAVALQLSAQYQANFPDGRRGEEVGRWLQELTERELNAANADAGAHGSDIAEPGTNDEQGNKADSPKAGAVEEGPPRPNDNGKPGEDPAASGERSAPSEPQAPKN
jgi:hypothetical protein